MDELDEMLDTLSGEDNKKQAGAVPAKPLSENTASSEDPFDQMADSLAVQQSSQITGNVNAASKTTPDTFAKVSKDAKAMELPVAIAEKHAKMVSDQAYNKFFLETLETNPALKKFYAKEKNVKMSHDDIGALSRINDFMRLRQAMQYDETPWYEVFTQLPGQVSGMAKMMAGGLTQSFGETTAISRVRALSTLYEKSQNITEIEKAKQEADQLRIKELRAEISKEPASQSFLSYFGLAEPSAASKELGKMFRQTSKRVNSNFDKALRDNPVSKVGSELAEAGKKQFERENPKFQSGSIPYYINNILLGTLQMGPSILASIATRNPNVGLTMISSQVFGQTYAEARKRGFDIKNATSEAVFKSAIEYVSEKVPLGILTREGGRLLNRSLKSMGAEGLQEMFVEAIDIGYDMAILDKSMTLSQAYTRLKDAGIIGAGVGGALSISTALPKQYIENRRGKRQLDAATERVEAMRGVAAENQDRLNNIIDESLNTKTAGRDEETLREALSTLAEDTGSETVFLSEAGATEFFQSQGLDPDVMYQNMGVADQLENVRANGHYLEVPLESFVTVEGIAELKDGLSKDMKFSDSAGSLTPRELDMLEEHAGTTFASFIANMESEGFTNTASGEASVYDAIFDQVQSTGRFSNADARAMSSLWRGVFKSLGDRTGQDPFALLQQVLPTIQNRPLKLPRADTELDIQINAAKADRGVPGLSDFPMLDIIRQRGGVKIGSELAGELTAMGITPQTHKGLFKKTTGLSSVDTFDESDGILENMERTTEGGGFVASSEILSAIESEGRGLPLRTDDEDAQIREYEEGVARFIDSMDMLGIDLTQNNEDIKEQIRQAQSELDSISGEEEFMQMPKAENLSQEQIIALDRFLDGRPDGAAIREQLEIHKGTPYADQAVYGALTRQHLEDLLAGREVNYDSALSNERYPKLAEAAKKGEEHLWGYLEKNSMIGNAAKPVNAVNSSFVNCRPSKDCAKFCYATKGNYRYDGTVFKSEIVNWAIERDPIRAGKLTARQYQATAEFYMDKALRLMDKGDLGPGWVSFIEELNRNKVRIQVFSKRPEILRQIPDMNLRLLSVDDSNSRQMAEDNPDLDLAVVYGGVEDVAFLEKYADRVQVILPVKLGRTLLREDQISPIPKKLKRYVCPVDGGKKKIGKTQDGDWNCTRCDINGGVGCFHGKATGRVLEQLKKDVNDDGDELATRIEELSGLANELEGDQRQLLLGRIDLLVSAIRRGAKLETEDGIIKEIEEGRDSLTNQDGSEFFQSDEDVTSSTEFKTWFKDSKIVDDNGKPMPVFHGSPNNLSDGEFAFNPDRIGSTTDSGFFGRGFYFSPYKSEASFYGDSVGSYYLSIQNPLDLDNQSGNLTAVGHFMDWAPKLDKIGALTDTQKTAFESIKKIDAYLEENIEYLVGQQNDGSDGWFSRVQYFETGEGGPTKPPVASQKTYTHDGNPVIIDPSVVKTYEQWKATEERNADIIYDENKDTGTGPKKAAVTRAQGRFFAAIRKAYPDLPTQDEILLQNILAGTNDASVNTIFSQGEEKTVTKKKVNGNPPPQPYGPLTEEMPIGSRGYALTKEEAFERLRDRFIDTAKFSLKDQYPGLEDMQFRLSDYIRTEGNAESVSKGAKENGYDGIQYGDEIIAFEPTQIKSVDNSGQFNSEDPRTFYQDKNNKPKGSFVISEDRSKRIISLFETADPSTFLHESGHFFLELMRDLAADPATASAFADDNAKLLEWLGVESWDKIEMVHHEKWARGMEAYLFEGKAPTKELQSSFRRFSDWLIEIYKEIRNLNVNMTPEIIGVMDRLVATDAEIELAKANDSFGPMPTSEAFVNAADAAAYQKLAASVEEDVRQRMLRKLLRDIKKKKSGEYLLAMERTEKELLEQYKQAPVWRAISYLRRGEFLDRDTPEDIKPVKLRKDQLVDLIGQDSLSLLPGGSGRTGIYQTKEGGHNPEHIAELFGFDAAHQMIEAILELAEVTVNQDGSRSSRYPTMSEVIRNEATNIVDDTLGLSMDPNRIKSEAIDALHGADRGDMIAAEIDMLRKAGGMRLLEKKAEQDIAQTGAVPDKEYRDAIKESEESLDPVDPSASINLAMDVARRNAARNQRRAQSAAVKTTKEIQRIPPAVVKEAARRHVMTLTRKELGNLNKFQQAELKAAKRSEIAIAKRDYDEAADAKWQQLWNHYVFGEARKAQVAMEKAEKVFARFRKAKDYRKMAMDNDYIKYAQTILSAYGLGPNAIDRSEAAAQLPLIDAWADAQNEIHGTGIVLPTEIITDPKPEEQMTYEQFMFLKDGIASLSKVGRDQSQEAAKIYDSDLDEIIESLEFHSKQRDDRPMYDSKWFDLKEFGAGILAQMRKAESLARELDGFKDMGPFWRRLIMPISEATSQEADLTYNNTKAMREIMAIQKDRKSGWWTKKFTIAGLPPMSKDRILSVALNVGNKYNRDTLAEGHGYSEEQIDAIISELDETDWKFVQAMWDHINSFWPQISAMEERVTGFSPPKVQADPVILNGVEVAKGGYYPIKFDKNESIKTFANAQDQQEKDLKRGISANAATVHSFTKARQGNKNQKLDLRLDVVFGHMTSVIHDLSHRERVIEVNKFLNNKRVAEALMDIRGPRASEELSHWLKNIAAGNVEPVKAIDKIFRHIRFGVSIAEMGMSLRTASVQVFGITNTIGVIGEEWSLRGSQSFYSDPGTNLEIIYKKSPMMRQRATTFDQNAHDQLKKVKPGGKLETFRTASFYMCSKMDLAVAAPTWWGAYQKVLAGEVEGVSMSEEDAVLYADSTVRRSQGSGEPMNLTSFQSGGEGHKVWAAFMTFFAAHYQMQLEETKKVGQKPPSVMNSIFYAKQIFWLTVFPALISSFILDGGPGEDESWLEWSAKLSAAYAVGGFPIFRDVLQGTISDFGFGGPPLMRVLEGVSDGAKAVASDDLSRFQYKNYAMLVGYLGLLPTRQAVRTIDYFERYAAGQFEYFNPWKAFVVGYKKPK